MRRVAVLMILGSALGSAAVAMPVQAAGGADAVAQGSSDQPYWRSGALPGGALLLFIPPSVTLDDYPKAARRADLEGTSILALQINPAGEIISCTTARSSGWTILDEQACRLYRARAMFRVRGTNEPVTIQAPVTWKLVD